MNIRFDKTKVYMALPLLLIIILTVSAFYVPFTDPVSGAASEVLNFRPSSLKIMPKRLIAGTTDRKGPFDFSDAKTLHVNDELRGEEKHETNVSLIVISGEKRMAIIDGRTVTVGDSIGSMRIAKIESNRILLQDRSAQWLYIQEEQ